MTDIDFVITELEVVIKTNERNARASFVFIDETPNFPKVNQILNNIEDEDDAYIVSHSISTTDINEKTNLNGLNFTKH